MAYGHVPAPKKTSTLYARLYSLPNKAISTQRDAILAWPIDCSSGQEVPPALAKELQKVFNNELEKGVTYPQRGPMSEEEFRGYFLSYDLIVGVLLSQEHADALNTGKKAIPKTGLQVDVPKDFFETFGWTDRYAFSYYIKVSWNQAQSYTFIVDFYFVKPNYPGRSSHLCNGGFVVPPVHRGLGLGGIAAISFLYYAPRCGYRGSVFNLVYANNEASVRIWERLGFDRVGRIPQAGLLRTADGKSEEYIDAWVIHGDFEKLGLEGVPRP